MKRKTKRKPLTQQELAEKKASAKLKIEQRPGGNLMKLAAVPKGTSQGTDRLRLIRHQAMIDYITDPDNRPIKHHFGRKDRQYSQYTAFKTFRDWCADDGWVSRREQFWNQLSLRILDQEQERLLEEQKQEIAQLRHVRNHVYEHLLPLVEPDGETVLRYPALDKHGEVHPLAGKPVLPYHISSYDKAIKSFLEVDERLMTKRGEVTKRTEAAAQPAAVPAPGVSSLDPVTQSVRFTPEQLRAMSRSLLREKQPELAQPLVIDADEEADQDAGNTI